MKPELANRFELTGRGALVTGGAAGIGEGIAHVLAAAGAEVTIFDLDGGWTRV